MKIRLHKGDLPEGLDLGSTVAVDTETLGLNPGRDRLCLIQLSAGDGSAHLVQFARDQYEAKNLKKMLSNPNVLKLYHFARFDLATILRYLGVVAGPVYCTRTASKIARTYTDKHGLKDLVKKHSERRGYLLEQHAPRVGPERMPRPEDLFFDEPERTSGYAGVGRLP